MTRIARKPENDAVFSAKPVTPRDRHFARCRSFTTKDWWHFHLGLSAPKDSPHHVTNDQLRILLFFVRAAQMDSAPSFTLGEIAKECGISRAHAKRIMRGMRQRHMAHSIGPDGSEKLYELLAWEQWLPASAMATKPRSKQERMRMRDGRVSVTGRGAADLDVNEARFFNAAGEPVGKALQPSSVEAASFDLPVKLEPEQRKSAQKVPGAQTHPVAESGSQPHSGCMDAPGIGSAEPSSSVPPVWVPVAEWAEFRRMRRLIGKPMTAHAVDIAIRTLLELKALGHEPRAVLEQSILNSWSGLYPIKGGKEGDRGGGVHGADSRNRKATGGIAPPKGKQYPKPDRITV